MKELKGKADGTMVKEVVDSLFNTFMYTVKFLTTLVENHQILAYTVIFLGLIFEGEVVVITTGVLAYLGALDFTLSTCFYFTGSFVKTFVLYYLGEILNKNLVTINFSIY